MIHRRRHLRRHGDGAGRVARIEPGLPTADITFSLPRWSQTGEDAGTWRRLGGIHFATGDVNGRALGRQVATFVDSKANQYINGETAG